MRSAALIIGVTAALGGCTQLEPVTADACGNLVIEAGEQCDGAAPAGASCGTDAPAACRFVCDGDASCPTGLACGAEGVCVASTERYVPLELAPRYRFTASQVFAGDVDGDRRDDLIGVGTTLRVRFGAPEAALMTEYDKPVRTPTGPAALGDFDGQPGLDLIYPADAGVFTLLSRGREFDAVPYASAQVLAPRAPARACDAPAGSGWSTCRRGDLNRDGVPDLVGYVSGRDNVELRVGRAEGSTPYLLDTADLVTDVDVGDLDGDGFDDLAYATRPAGPTGVATVRVVFGAPQPAAFVDLALTHATAVRGLAIADASTPADGLVDLLVDRDLDGNRGVAVFLGDSSRSLTAPFALAGPRPTLDTPYAVVAGEFVGGPGSGVDVMAYATNPAAPSEVFLWWLRGESAEDAQLSLGAVDAVGRGTVAFLGDEWAVADVLGDPSASNGPDEVLGLAASAAACPGPSLATLVPSARNTGTDLLRRTCLDVDGDDWAPANVAFGPRGQAVAIADRPERLWLGVSDAFEQASASGRLGGRTLAVPGATGCRDYAIGRHARGPAVDVSALCEVAGVTTLVLARGEATGAALATGFAVPGATGKVVGDFNGDGLDDLGLRFGADVAIVLQCSADMVGRHGEVLTMRRALAIALVLATATPAGATEDRPGAAARAASPAPGDQARQAFRVGVQAFRANQFGVAARAFASAYELDPRPEVGFSIAQANRLQYFVDREPWRVQRAVELYQAYLVALPRGPRARDAIGSLAELEPMLGELRRRGELRPLVVVPRTQLVIGTEVANATATVDGRPVALWEPLDVAPGTRAIEVQAPGYEPVRRRVVLADGRFVPVDVTLAPRPGRLRIATEAGAQLFVDGRPVEDPTRAIAVAPGAHFVSITRRGRVPWSDTITVARDADAITRATLEPTGQRRASRWVLGGAAVLGAAALGGAAWTYAAVRDARALDDRRQAGLATPADLARYNQAVDARDTRARVTLAIGVGAAGVGLLGAALYVFDHRAPRPVPTPRLEVAPYASGDGAGVAVGGAW